MTKTVLPRLALLALILIPATAPASDKGIYFGFRAYPSGRLLCQEFVRGPGLEIHWRSFAVSDATVQVVAFYEAQHGKATREPEGGFTLRLPNRKDEVLTIYPAAKNDAYPHCAEKPNPGEQTVLLVSTATRG